jgi:hypothetical protein
MSFLLGAPFAWCAETPAPSSEPKELARYCETLVHQLGDEEFATRERSTLELIEIGLAAESALTAGTRHPDREVRYRSERILAIIHELDFQYRLDAFAAGRDGEHGLPGWDSYRDLFGGEEGARLLFIEMQQSEPHLMRSLEAGRQQIAKTIEARCAQLQSLQRATRQPVPLGSVLAMLFAVRDPEVDLGFQAGSTLSSFCYQAELQNAMNDAAKKPILRRLLGDWIQRGDGWTAYQSLTLAMRYELKEGLIPARKVLENPGNQPYIRQNGILAIAKLGDKSDYALLESLLEDESRCASQRISKTTYETQMRDVAVAALLIMAGEDPAKYGFDRIQRNETNVFITSTIGFDDDKKRQATIEKFKAFWKGLDEREE